MRLDLDAIRKRNTYRCFVCDGSGSDYGLQPCSYCNGGFYMHTDIAAMLAELERLYAAPVAEPVQPTTPGAREAAIAGELQRMLWKPRGGKLS